MCGCSFLVFLHLVCLAYVLVYVGVLYRGLFDCFRKTMRTEGLAALYKGFPAHYLR